MSKTITVPEADIQALRIAQYTIKTGDPADDRAAADAFTRLLDDEQEEFTCLGLRCTVRRGLMGWCGYVDVPEGHPWHGRHHREIDAEAGPNGLTYSDCYADGEREGGAWRVGFDCGGLEEARGETRYLAGQAAAMRKEEAP